MRSLANALGDINGRGPSERRGGGNTALTHYEAPRRPIILRFLPDRAAGAGGSRRKGRSPWALLSQIFFASSVAYGLLLGGHADDVIATVKKHTTSAATQVGFTIGKLTIEGQLRTGDESLVEALGVNKGTSILSFDTAAAQSRVETLPWVRQAEVMRLLPSTLKVIIKERQPYARWQLKGETYLIGEDGAIIGKSVYDRDATLPLVVGEGAATNFAALDRVLSRHSTLQSRLLAAVRVADRRWTLKLEDGIDILLPEARVADALDWIIEADRKHALLSRALSRVDLRLGDRVSVRLNAAALAEKTQAETGKDPSQDT